MQSNFRVYLLSSFVGDLVFPIFALFLPLLAYELGADPLEVGLVGGASYSMYSFMPFVMGRYLDKMKAQKTFMVLSFSLLVATSLLYAFASTALELIILRVLEGVSWAMIWPTIDAAMAEDTREASKSFSIYNCFWSASAAIGPLVGVALVALLTQVRYIFLVTSLVLLALTIVNLVGLTGKRFSNEERQIDGSRPAEGRLAIDLGQAVPAPNLGKTQALVFFMIAVAVVQAGRSTLFTFFPPLAQSLGLSVLLIGSVGFIFGGTRFLFFLMTTRDSLRRTLLSKANTRKNTLVALTVASLSGVLPIIPDKSGILDFVSFALSGTSLSVITTISQQRMISEAEPGQTGRNSGLFESSVGIGATLGPILGGLMSGHSLTVPFLVPPLSLVLVPFLYVLFRDKTVVPHPEGR